MIIVLSLLLPCPSATLSKANQHIGQAFASMKSRNFVAASASFAKGLRALKPLTTSAKRIAAAKSVGYYP